MKPSTTTILNHFNLQQQTPWTTSTFNNKPPEPLEKWLPCLIESCEAYECVKQEEKEDSMIKLSGGLLQTAPHYFINHNIPPLDLLHLYDNALCLWYSVWDGFKSSKLCKKTNWTCNYLLLGVVREEKHERPSICLFLLIIK